MACFQLVSHCQDRRCLTVKVIQGNITAIAEVDRPFPKLRAHVLDGAADTRLVREYFDAGADRFYGTSCCISILRGEEAVEPLNVGQR